jgi:hypothetical protein
MNLKKISFLRFFLLVSSIFIAISSLSGQYCEGKGYRQFDFWKGKWEVYRPGTDTLLGRNEIKTIAKGCALLENWTGQSGFKGQSINTYDQHKDLWRQRWVDQTGQVIDFEGSAGKYFVELRAMTKEPGEDSLFHLMTYEFDPEKQEILQIWKQKTAEKEWSVVFRGQYKKLSEGIGTLLSGLDWEEASGAA